jgi:hypothetical protein
LCFWGQFAAAGSVFSWVSPAVQGAILGLIGRCLSDSGVAAVSYNVLPGWHLRNPVKDILRFYWRPMTT